MLFPRHERQWLTLRAAFGHRSAARAIALQVRTATDVPTEFRLISCLTSDGMWRLEGSFPRSDVAFRAYLSRVREERLTDYFDHRPMQMPPKWIVPSPEGAFLTAPAVPGEAAVSSESPPRPSLWQRFLHPARGG
jgi:hypothetical protein